MLTSSRFRTLLIKFNGKEEKGSSIGTFCHFFSKLSFPQQCRFFSKNNHNHGGILIEFAFCIPVCISLLFFVNDHYRFYELRGKIRSEAYLIGSMIQQISNTRSDKQLTQRELCRITAASTLNVFHAGGMTSEYSIPGLTFEVDYRYVKRVSDNEYLCQNFYIYPNINDSAHFEVGTSGELASQTESTVREVHPDLICGKDGEEKLLILCQYRSLSNKSRIGLQILTPKTNDIYHTAYSQRAKNNNFTYNLIITPKPGLFPVR